MPLDEDNVFNGTKTLGAPDDFVPFQGLFILSSRYSFADNIHSE